MRNTADVTGGKPIAVLLQSILSVSAINPLVALPFTTSTVERERCYSFIFSLLYYYLLYYSCYIHINFPLELLYLLKNRIKIRLIRQRETTLLYTMMMIMISNIPLLTY
jgi:hypothetical protein